MTIFIIPGFRQNVTDVAWRKINKIAQKHFAQVVMFQPTWNYHTLEDWLKEFNQLRQKYSAPQVVLGFSFGAMIAYVSSSMMNTKAAVLCSLSPYFAEELPKIKSWWKQKVGQKRIQVFQKLKFGQLAKANQTKTYLLVGEKESPWCHHRYQDALNSLTDAKGFIVPQTKHDITDKQYLVMVEKALGLLSN